MCVVCLLHLQEKKQRSVKEKRNVTVYLMLFDSPTTGASVFSPPRGKVPVMRIMTGIFALVRALPSASLHLDTLSGGSGGRETREAQTAFDVFSIIANYIFRRHPQCPGQVFSTPYELAVTARYAKVLVLHHTCKKFMEGKHIFCFFIALNHLRASVCRTNAFSLKVAVKIQELLRVS